FKSRAESEYNRRDGGKHRQPAGEARPYRGVRGLPWLPDPLYLAAILRARENLPALARAALAAWRICGHGLRDRFVRVVPQRQIPRQRCAGRRDGCGSTRAQVRNTLIFPKQGLLGGRLRGAKTLQSFFGRGKCLFPLTEREAHL